MTVADIVASMAAAEEDIRAAYIGQEFGLGDMYAPGSTGVFEYQPLSHVSDDIPLNVALPEPATLTFLTLGGLAILRRRRRQELENTDMVPIEIRRTNPPKEIPTYVCGLV